MGLSLNSLNTNIAAYHAQSNIGKASSMATSSIARLSSGDRIVSASDDVAAMSAGTSLMTNVTTLRMALINTSQGSSLLQVADGALSQISSILQRQKAIAIQAGAGSLTSAERSFLNQEFQNLAQEIDRLVGNTNFNGVTLLNGSLSERVDVADVSEAGESATGSINFAVNFSDGEQLTLNGVTITVDATPTAAQVQLGSSIEQTVDNIVDFLNAASTNSNFTAAQQLALSQAEYSADGQNLVITARNAGTQGEVYTIDATATYFSNNAGNFTGAINAQYGGSTYVYSSANDIAVTSTTATAAAVAPAAPTDGFTVGDDITIKIGGGAAITVHSFTATDTLETVVAGINEDSDITGVTARIIGSSGAYNLVFEHSGIVTDPADTSSDITVGIATAHNGNGGINAATTTSVNTLYAIAGGDDTGLSAGRTRGYGVVGNDILVGQSQLSAEVRVIFPEIADADLQSSTNFGQAAATDITVGGVSFFFTPGGTGPTEAAIGTTLEETLDNMVATINAYEGIGRVTYGLNQVEAYRDGTDIVIRTKDVGNAASSNGVATGTLAVTNAGTNLPTGASITNGGNLNNGQNQGVNTSGITNDAFIGQIGGFTAEYTGTANSVSLSVTVGEHTYTATNVTTNPTGGASTVRLVSQDGGGYFDIQLASGNGEAVASQADADTFVQRINAGFEGLNFYQSRSISSYNGDSPILTEGVVTGTLIGTTFDLQGTNFEDISIDSIRVTAPTGSSENGKIVITVNGEEFTSAANIGSELGANSVFRFTSATDANRFLEFRTGGVAIEFGEADEAASFQAALENAFGVGDGSAALNFQVGVTTSDTLQIGVDNVTTSKLYNGQALNVLTEESAQTASDALDDAIDMVTSVRAEIGALQSRFDFAAANVESSIQNQDAARGVLLDTDIASESTMFATAQVQLQAGISVLAQANLLPQQMLKLIG